MRDYTKIVPIEFYNTKLAKRNHPSFRTVGELKEILSKLPDELMFDHDFCEVSEVLVYNISDGIDRITVGIREAE